MDSRSKIGDGRLKVLVDYQIKKKCRDFAEESAKTQRDFRSGGTLRRSMDKMIGDIERGKLAEAVVQRFLESHGIKIDLDFDIYPRGIWDDGDFTLKGMKFSIKASKAYAKWLLLESKDIERNYLFDYYIFVNVDKNLEGGIVRGYATMKDVLGFTKLKKGDFLPNTNTVLDADNHGREVKYLSQNWDQILGVLK